MNLTANEWLYQNPSYLSMLCKDVLSDDWTHIDSDCIISTRAVSSNKPSGKNKSATIYPVLKRKCPDGISRRFYCHHISYLAKHVKTGKLMWDYKEYDVSHECHNKFCVNPEHLALLSKKEHASKRINCIGNVECSQCHVSFILCKHESRCLTTEYRICSNCSLNK